jgi:AraC-like DNA-binding protein
MGLAYTWSSMSDEPVHMLHCHAEYEIYYFIHGDVEYRVEGQPYTPAPESILLIPPNCVHGVTVRSSRLYQRASVHFLPELLDEEERALLPDIFQVSGGYYPDISTNRIDFLFKSVLDCKNMDGLLRKTAVKHRIIALLTHIYQLNLRNMDYSASRNKRIQAILLYLNDNLREDLSLDQIARRFTVNKNHLNAIFRREMGTTVVHYLRIKRLALARQEMRKGATADEAAYKAGFNDYSNFYRAYKMFFGTMPSAQTEEERKIFTGYR